MQTALLPGPVKGAPMLERCQLILVAWHEQTSAEQHIHRLRRMHNRMTGSGTWRPEQSQTRVRDGLFGERFKLLNAWQQIGLLLLNEHRPMERFLQTSETAMPFSTCQHNPWVSITCRTVQKHQGRFSDRRTIDQNRLRIHIEPPGCTAIAITVRGKDPQIVAQSLRLTTGLECWGQVDDVQPRAGPLV